MITLEYGGKPATATLLPDGGMWLMLDADPGFGPMAFRVPFTASTDIQGGDPADLLTLANQIDTRARFIGAERSRQWHQGEATRLRELARTAQSERDEAAFWADYYASLDSAQ